MTARTTVPLPGLLLLLSCAAVAAAQTTRPAAAEPEIGTAVYVGGELLKDYQPEPALVTKQTRVDKPKFSAVDFHCHWSIREDPKQLLEAMDDLGIARSVNLSGGHGTELDQMLERFTGVAPDRLITFCNLDFDQIDDPAFGRNMADFLTRAHERGARGLKIFKNLGLTVKDKGGRVVPVDDARLDPVWARCGELGMPVLIHSADPVAFFYPVDRYNERWMQLKRHPSWSFHGANFPRYEDVLAQHNRVIKRHPKTTFVSAHLANSGENLVQLARWLDEMPNLYVDLSGRVSELGRQPYAARKFLIDYQDRVLFGTDRYPGRPDQPRHRIYYRFLETADEYFKYYDHPFPPAGDWRIYGVFLPDEVLEKIYAGNADRLLGFTK
jgi:predicted TIM-barrel fold metal-dependent hydrolase